MIVRTLTGTGQEKDLTDSKNAGKGIARGAGVWSVPSDVPRVMQLGCCDTPQIIPS